MKRIPISVMAVVLRRRGGEVGYLLLKRADARNGFWQPVTGSLLPGETPPDAVIREVREETGITEFEQLHDLHYSHEFEIVPHRLHEYEPGVRINLEHCFAVRAAPATRVRLSDEHEAFGWFPFDQAIERLAYQETRIVFKRVREACDRGEI